MLDQKYFNKVLKFFNNDNNKAWYWIKTANPNLGGMSPIEMIRCGRSDKLKKFIDSRLDK